MRMSAVLSIFVLTVFSTPSWASDFSIIVCAPLEEAQNLLKSQNEKDDSKMLTYRSRIQNFIQNAQTTIDTSLKNNDTATIAITCGMVDDATESFTRTCYSDSGEELNLQTIEEFCKSIASR